MGVLWTTYFIFIFKCVLVK